MTEKSSITIDQQQSLVPENFKYHLKKAGIPLGSFAPTPLSTCQEGLVSKEYLKKLRNSMNDKGPEHIKRLKGDRLRDYFNFSKWVNDVLKVMK